MVEALKNVWISNECKSKTKVNIEYTCAFSKYGSYGADGFRGLKWNSSTLLRNKARTGRIVYFRRDTHPGITISYKLWAGNFVVNDTGLYSKATGEPLRLWSQPDKSIGDRIRALKEAIF